MLITWECLQNYNNSIPLPKDTRTNEVCKSYHDFLRFLEKNHLDINKYIKNKLFTPSENLDYIITQNKYPYNVTSDIKHYILWINPKKDIKYTQNDLDNIIKDYMNLLSSDKNQLSNYNFFKNHVKSRSINKILHYQVFYK